MKKLLSVVILLAVIAAMFACAQATSGKEDYSVEGWYTVETEVPEDHDYSYIYSAPSSTQGKNLCKVNDGELVYVYYKVRGSGSKNYFWAYCEYEDTTGYIHIENVKPVTGEDLGPYLGTMTIVNCNQWVSLRKLPDATSPRLARVYKWDEVEAYYYDDEWSACYYGDEFGYIKTEFLKPAFFFFKY